MRLYIAAFIYILFSCPHLKVSGQEEKDVLSFRVLSYNVENLFDVKHDTLKNDYEYVGGASGRYWTYRRYRKKLDAVARTIVAAGEWSFPALVALCEVENDHVMRDLTHYSLLRKAGYRYVMTESPDERGIDVALLYRQHLFKLLSFQGVSVPPPKERSRPTRDILHVSGLLLTGDTLDVLVCHFPSRFGGAKASEPYRLVAARVVRRLADSLFRVRQYPQLLVMGDLNDDPRSRCVREVLRVEDPPLEEAEQPLPDVLYHLLSRQASESRHKGTYKYKGIWEWIDHLIVSGNLLRRNAPLSTNESRAKVVQLPFLLVEDERYGGVQPFRTYNGMRYWGGYSDHLPVCVDFKLIY